MDVGGDAQSFHHLVTQRRLARLREFLRNLSAGQASFGCLDGRVWSQSRLEGASFSIDVWLGGVFGFFVGFNLPRNRYYIQFLANLQSLWWHIRWYFPKGSASDSTA